MPDKFPTEDQIRSSLGFAFINHLAITACGVGYGEKVNEVAVLLQKELPEMLVRVRNAATAKYVPTP